MPTKSLLGVNVTTPVVGSITYVPTVLPSLVAGTSVESVVFPVVGSINLAGLAELGVKLSPFPSLKVGVPVCVSPCFPTDVVF